MKTIPSLLTLCAVTLLSVSCGGKHSSSKHPFKIEPITVKLDNCGLADSFNTIGRDLAQDYDIKLYRETVNLVLNDIRAQKEFSAKTFWQNLTPSVRDALNYELNIHIIKNRSVDVTAVYQSTAFYFGYIKDQFNEGLVYQVKDKKHQIYSFQVRGVKGTTIKMMNYVCGHFLENDLKGYEGGEEVVRVGNVQELYECRTPSKSMILMEMKDEFYLKAGSVLRRLSAKSLEKKDKKRRLELKYNSPEVSFQVNVRKKRGEDINTWEGKRSVIELSTPEYEISEDGACDAMINTFET